MIRNTLPPFTIGARPWAATDHEVCAAGDEHALRTLGEQLEELIQRIRPLEL